MENPSWRKILVNISANLTLGCVMILGFTLLFLFSWNVGVVGLIPSFRELNFTTSLALCTGGYVLNTIFDFWLARLLNAKKQLHLLELSMLELRKDILKYGRRE